MNQVSDSQFLPLKSLKTNKFSKLVVNEAKVKLDEDFFSILCLFCN